MFDPDSLADAVRSYQMNGARNQEVRLPWPVLVVATVAVLIVCAAVLAA